ncbi:hypothetical protein TNCV_2021121 [Trichonephila clavipes]|nr:hypothetical protein TNCV_2021121 [Trichonephila clavipes]
MERSIDHHESQRPRTSAGLSRVTKWRDAWTACSTVVEGYSSTHLKNSSCVWPVGFHSQLAFWKSYSSIEAIRSLFLLLQ